MERSDFIRRLVSMSLITSLFPLRSLESLAAGASTERMPLLFVGHGSPMNAIEDNRFTQNWRQIAQKLPKPTAILCISAHWETRGSWVTAMEKPKTIHDFGGFPQALFDAQYPAPGSLWLAEATQTALQPALVGADTEHWGLDHGTWSILKPMFPEADVPVVQLSLDRNLNGEGHYRLAQSLKSLRRKGVLIIGSGNMVHNLRLMQPLGGNLNAEHGLGWAKEAGELFNKLIREGRHSELSNFRNLGNAVQLAIPTPEHFLPLLYVLALQEKDEEAQFFNDQYIAGSLNMTSLLFGQP